MLDEKGYFYIIDAILAVVLLLVVFLIVNSAISISDDSTDDIKNSKDVQDVMEILSAKVNFTDNTFIGDISKILEDGGNSKESVREVSKISKDRLSSFNLENYRFTENNVLKGKTLASNGDYSKAKDVAVATRNYDDYSYSLSTW